MGRRDWKRKKKRRKDSREIKIKKSRGGGRKIGRRRIAKNERSRK